jgi:hypothetical protein
MTAADVLWLDWHPHRTVRMTGTTLLHPVLRGIPGLLTL